MAHVIVPVGPPTRAPRRSGSQSAQSVSAVSGAAEQQRSCTYVGTDVRIGLSVVIPNHEGRSFFPHSTPELNIPMRRACMYSYSSLLLASSYVASGRVSAFTLASSSAVYPAPAAAAVARDIMTSPSGLAMVRNRGLEIPEEGATPLRKYFCFELSCSIVLMTVSTAM